MANTEDPYFTRPMSEKSATGKSPGPGELPPVLPWLGVYVVNMIMPIYFARMITDLAGRIGMVSGILLVFGLGCRLCFWSRRNMLAVVYGGWIVAFFQAVPIFHMIAGSIGVGAAAALGTTTGRRADFVDSVPGGLIATLVTGAILLTVAAALGVLVRGIIGRFGRRAIKPDRWPEPPAGIKAKVGDFDDDRSKRAARTFAWIPWTIFGFLIFAALCVVAVAVLAFLFRLDTAPKTRVIASTDAAQSVAHLLVHCELFGPVVAPDPEYSTRRKAIVKRIRSSRGFTESDGFHGDGIDWYEADLSPELAADLRIQLAQSPIVKPAGYFPTRGEYAPDWWPTNWPAGSICHEYHLMYFVMPPTGTRLWIQVIRT